MRSCNICRRFELALALVAMACSNSSSAPDAGGGCVVDASGNLADHAELARCATISQDDAGGFTLEVAATTPSLSSLSASIDLGASPGAAVLSSDTVASWSASAAAGSSSCAFEAGSSSVPVGSFTLALDSVDAAKGTAHGTLSIVAYVHAPPSTDCGFDDAESLTIRF